MSSRQASSPGPRSSGAFTPLLNRGELKEETVPSRTPAQGIEMLVRTMTGFNDALEHYVAYQDKALWKFNELFSAYLYSVYLLKQCVESSNAENSREDPLAELMQERKRLEELKREYQLLSSRDDIAMSSPRKDTLFSVPKTTMRPMLSEGPQRVPVAPDDASSDSFVVFPEANKRRSLLRPNPNEPPRYLQGLYDKTSQENIRRQIKPSRSAQRQSTRYTYAPPTANAQSAQANARAHARANAPNPHARNTSNAHLSAGVQNPAPGTRTGFLRKGAAAARREALRTRGGRPPYRP